MQLKELIGDSYVLCLCEGGAETAIIDMLLDHDKLIFTREELILNKIHKRECVERIQEKYLGLSYEKPVVIIRIIDSIKEQFKLTKAYKDRYKVYSAATNPEIEILLILDKGELDEYTKRKSISKPSAYCKEMLGFRNVKSKTFMKEYFSDVERLIQSIKMHKRSFGKDHMTIYDLLNQNAKK
jgi:hypothetical protein